MNEQAQDSAPDVLTPAELQRVALRLWAEMRAEVRHPVAGRNAWWDQPLTVKQKPSATVAVKCGRCDGKGAIASFSVRFSGVCFACSGSGFRLISRAAYEKKKALRKAQGAYCAATPQ
jgi:hypothetical protein